MKIMIPASSSSSSSPHSVPHCIASALAAHYSRKEIAIFNSCSTLERLGWRMTPVEPKET
jgi:hypothetical protein